MKYALLFAAPFATVLQAADPTQPMFWSASQLKAADGSANAKLNPERHLGTERMLESAFIAFRNGNSGSSGRDGLSRLEVAMT